MAQEQGVKVSQNVPAGPLEHMSKPYVERLGHQLKELFP